MEPDGLAPRLRRLPERVVLGRAVRVAEGRLARLAGLALLRRRSVGRGLLIPRCSCVHTFGMRFRLDLLFISAEGRPIAVRRSVPPRRLVRCRGAAAVLEIPTRGER